MSKRPRDDSGAGGRDDSGAGGVKNKATDALDIQLRAVQGWDDVKQLFGKEVETYAELEVGTFLSDYEAWFMSKAEAAGITMVAVPFLNKCKQHIKRPKVHEDEAPERFMIELPTPESTRRLSLEAEKNVDIPNVQLSSRSRLGPFLKFVNREKSINVLLKHAADQYGKYLRGFGEKEAQFAACSGGPGLGKTTFCRKAFSRAVDGNEQDKTAIWEGVDDQFQGIVGACVESGRQYRISFGKPTPLQEVEKLQGNRVRSLALRLIRAASGSAPKDFEWNTLPEGGSLLKDVVEKLSGGDEKALIVLNLDETNVIMSSDEGIQYLKDVLAALMEVNQQHAGFVLATLSGTNARALHDLLREFSSGVAPKEIPLPLLEVGHMQEVLLDLGARETPVTSLGQQLDFVLEVLGGVPRYLEMLAFLLGQDGDTFTHAQYCERLNGPGSDTPHFLEGVKGLILQQYGDDFATMLQGVKVDAIVALSLFAWPVRREDILGENTIAQLESRGIVFLQPRPDKFLTIQMPLVLMLFGARRGTDTAMLLRHFDIMLSSDDNEHNSLAVLSMKCHGLEQLGVPISLNRLLPLDQGAFPKLDQTWAQKRLICQKYGLWEAETRITKASWSVALQTLRICGAFVVNCKGAPFADMIIVTKGGEFVIFLQEKQREQAKKQILADKTVPTLKVETVQKEHDKCNVDTPHLFVMITDERFDAFADLKSNEIVLPYDQHGAVMGPLLALLRRFNHSNKRKIAVK